MKTLLALFLLTTATALADAPFPGLKVIMTPEEYSRAGLDALTPDQIGVIDAAIIRHYIGTVNMAASQQAEQYTQEAVTEAVTKEKNASWLSHVGLPSFGGDWKNQPSIKAVCTGWATGNSFKLDNGQVWEGVEPLRMELTNKDIEIQPRPNGGFDLYVNGKNTAMRVIRVK
jgi:hypothetical protein